MRKINTLKTIVDYLWIVTIPIGTLIILVFIPSVFIINFEASSFEFLNFHIQDTFSSKLLITIKATNYLFILYAFHLFRNVLRYFQRVKIFDPQVISSFLKIGNLLVIAGIISLIINIISRIYFKESISISFGFNTDIILIALGLFFQILSEVFKVAKKATEENDLTI